MTIAPDGGNKTRERYEMWNEERCHETRQQQIKPFEYVCLATTMMLTEHTALEESVLQLQ